MNTPQSATEVPAFIGGNPDTVTAKALVEDLNKEDIAQFKAQIIKAKSGQIQLEDLFISFEEMALSGRHSVLEIANILRAEFPKVSAKYLNQYVLVSYPENFTRYMSMIRRDTNDLPQGWQWENSGKFLLKQTEEA